MKSLQLIEEQPRLPPPALAECSSVILRNRLDRALNEFRRGRLAQLARDHSLLDGPMGSVPFERRDIEFIGSLQQFLAQKVATSRIDLEVERHLPSPAEHTGHVSQRQRWDRSRLPRTSTAPALPSMPSTSRWTVRGMFLRQE